MAAAGKTQGDGITRATRQLTDVDASITGVVWNQLDVEDRQYGYYYQYYAYGQQGESGETSPARGT